MAQQNSYVKFGGHTMAKSIKALDISDKPFMSFYYPERAAILPSGEIIDSNVNVFDGYMEETRIAEHTIDYSYIRLPEIISFKNQCYGNFKNGEANDQNQSIW